MTCGPFHKLLSRKSQPGGCSAQHGPTNPQPSDPEAGRRVGRPAVGPPGPGSRTDTGRFGVALPSRRLDRAVDTHARSGPWSRADVHGTCGGRRGADIWTSYRAEIFRIFKKNWPDATLLIREGVSSSLEEWLLERRIDLAVLHNPVPLDGIEMIPILHEQMNLVTASGSEFQRSRVRFRDLEEYR